MTRPLSRPRGLAAVAALVLGALVWLGRNFLPNEATSTADRSAQTATSALESELLDVREALRDHARDVWVDGRGRVLRVLADDVEGARHQKFLLEIAPRAKVLIAHNIDLAERAPVREGDEVTFRGEYVWDERGGVVHWTHHDPARREIGGWLEVGGRHYE